MKGEDGQSSQAEQQRQFRKTAADYEPDNFQAKTPLQRLAIVVAGPAANFIVALVLLFGGALAFGVPTGAVSPTIEQLIPGIPPRRPACRRGHDRVGERPAGSRRRGAGRHDPPLGRKAAPLGYVRNGRRATVDVTPVLQKNAAGKMEGRVGSRAAGHAAGRRRPSRLGRGPSLRRVRRDGRRAR